jgi:VIT1/CCC1 family predicted Fe2+/Mn2+ transporter
METFFGWAIVILLLLPFALATVAVVALVLTITATVAYSIIAGVCQGLLTSNSPEKSSKNLGSKP